MRNVAIAACVLALASAAAPLMAQDNSDLAMRLEAILGDFHDRYGFPGATAAIVLPEGMAVTAATGLADLENGRIMTPDTPMLAASIGKTFVAATVLSLENERLLSRADLLSAHLGDRPWFDALPNADSITVDQLLHHNAGLPDHVHLPAFQEEWARVATDEGDFDPERLVTFVAGQDPLFEAGTDWAYSDTGYVLLGLVIEEVAEQPWHEAVRTRFLGPLALSGTVPSDRPDLPGLAIGYVSADNPFGMPERTADPGGQLLWDPVVESAGGGFASTSADLAKWGHLLFGGEAMTGPYLDRLLDGVPVNADSPGILYGAGVAIYADTPRGPVWGHGGWIPGFVSSLRHYADRGVTVAFQINTDVGVTDDTTDLVPALEAALADLALGSGDETDQP
jgi:D-alanyl-D-alanine carboxypeptidase